MNCTTVTGIGPGSWLRVRTGPGHGYGPLHEPCSRLYNGNEAGPSCWTTGDGAYDDPGYRHWTQAGAGDSFWGCVNDRYPDTGHPDAWKQRIRPCPL
ncbi:hypothetical protein [Streptomyces sp. enrichment culture]|uniref:hypothetical protein n=1 Tax=Streptomyces sp. enrichment culture TaxID=1795815 RepID=UPI003F573EE9